MDKIGILTSGGDAPGMNACIRAVVRTAIDRGLQPVGIRRGYCGLHDQDFVTLDRRAVANIIQRGGTILGTSRCEHFKTPEGLLVGARCLELADIKYLVLIGGDGTFRGGAALEAQSNVKLIGIPATVDNDVSGTDYTVGFDTAVNTALEAIDRIRDTADALERIFFVEVMGREAGFIAFEVGIAGGAEEILIPERHTDLDELSESLRESQKRGKRSSIIVVAEANETGRTVKIAEYVQERLQTTCRVCILGYIQRGGSPTARDRVLASKFGIAAVDGLISGKAGHAVCEVDGQMTYVPFKDTYKNPKSLDVSFLERSRVLSL